MSLLTTTTLAILYNAANAQEAQEHEAVTFWDHLWQKVYFPEEQWVIAQQSPPTGHTGDRRRRMDTGIFLVNPVLCRLEMVAAVEGKGRDAGPKGIEEVEMQAEQACKSRCLDTSGVWAVTFIGTKARVWKYTILPLPSWSSVTRDPDGEPTLENYIDANDVSLAPELDAAFRNMRTTIIPRGHHVLGSTSSPKQGC